MSVAVVASDTLRTGRRETRTCSACDGDRRLEQLSQSFTFEKREDRRGDLLGLGLIVFSGYAGDGVEIEQC